LKAKVRMLTSKMA